MATLGVWTVDDLSGEMAFQLKTKWQEGTSLGKIGGWGFQVEESQVQRLPGRNKRVCGSQSGEKVSGKRGGQGVNRGQSTSGFWIQNEVFRFNSSVLWSFLEGFKQRCGMIWFVFLNSSVWRVDFRKQAWRQRAANKLLQSTKQSCRWEMRLFGLRWW